MRNLGEGIALEVVVPEVSGRHRSSLPHCLVALEADPHEGDGMRSGVSGARTLRGGGHRHRMITILIHSHVRST